MHSKKATVFLTAVTLVLVPVATAVHANDSGHYDGAGVVVADAPTGGPADKTATIVDNGAVVCDDTDFQDGEASGTGGVCIPFKDVPEDRIVLDPDGNEFVGIEVTDDNVGKQVTFQVCIDNDGDQKCSFSPAGDFARNGTCPDEIRFSHEDDGDNINPLAVPNGFRDPNGAGPGDCGDNGGFPGWIVIVCAGEHAGGGLHTHQASSGEVRFDYPRTFQNGDFCGAPTAEKAYVVK